MWWIVWLGLGTAGAVMAYRKAPPARDSAERAKYAVLMPVMMGLCVILGPLGLLMFLFTSPLKVCPFCKVRLRRNASVCRACGRDVP